MVNFVYIATSLDGFIATIDGGVDWLNEIPNPEGHDYGFTEFMKGIDALVMGRKSFEKVLSFGVWPYDKPVFVLSRSKLNIPEELADIVKITSGSPREIVNQLAQLGYQNLYIDGGLTIQGFLDADLIDEMIITRVPILLGGGIPLFSTLSQKMQFILKKTEALNDMLVKSHYSRIRDC